MVPRGRGDLHRTGRQTPWSCIPRIEKSLDPAYWEDDSHLTDKGKKVFDEEKKAVSELMKIEAPIPGVGDVIAALVGVDAELARIAIDEAVAGGGKAKEIDKAEKEYAKALNQVGKGKFDKAIGYFKKAWQNGRKALGLKG